eukprot:7269755-Prymnesium_polylepis.1
MPRERLAGRSHGARELAPWGRVRAPANPRVVGNGQRCCGRLACIHQQGEEEALAPSEASFRLAVVAHRVAMHDMDVRIAIVMDVHKV